MKGERWGEEARQSSSLGAWPGLEDSRTEANSSSREHVKNLWDRAEVSSSVQQGLGPRLSLDNSDNHSNWHLVESWHHQVQRVPGVGKSEPHEPRMSNYF